MAWWLFQQLVTTGALVALAVGVCHVTRMGPVARHAVWVLVLIKFLTPPLVVWPWTVPDPLELSVEAQPEPLSPVGPTTVHLQSPPFDATTPDGPLPAGPSAVGQEAPIDEWFAWLLATWVLGSVCRASIELVRLLRLIRLTRSATPAGRDLTDRVVSLAGRMQIAPVPVVLVRGMSSPGVWGLARPRIVWPAHLSTGLCESGIDGLIVHELAHLKRRDHLIGWVELVAGVVWWWNPLFWYVRSAIREHAELACDAWVISVLPNGRRAYAESLLAMSIQAPSLEHSSMAVVGISATKRKALERRLVMIMKGRASLRLTFVGLCSLVAVAMATLPTWAASAQQATPPVVAAAPSAAPATAVSQAQAASVPRAIRVPPSDQVLTQVPAVRRQVASPTGRGRSLVAPSVPQAARDLESAYEKDQQALREKFIADLQRLQDELTKAGNLDDAVAVRDYVRRVTAGQRMLTFRPVAGRGVTSANSGRGGGTR